MANKPAAPSKDAIDLILNELIQIRDNMDDYRSIIGEMRVLVREIDARITSLSQ